MRYWLRPLGDIRAGAVRYGQGQFDAPIPVRGDDELGRLAGQINTMAGELRHMLDAKRALLLSISHELRSPLTRARLNAELVDEGPSRDALLRDLGEMRELISDLLESERLTAGHTALQREPVDLAALVEVAVHEQVPADVALELDLDADPWHRGGRPGAVAAAGAQPHWQRAAPWPAAVAGPAAPRRGRAGLHRPRPRPRRGHPRRCRSSARRSTGLMRRAGAAAVGSGWGCTCAGWWRRRMAGGWRCGRRSPGWRYKRGCRFADGWCVRQSAAWPGDTLPAMHDPTQTPPLTSAELDQLDAFLASLPAGAMNVEMLDGFF